MEASDEGFKGPFQPMYRLTARIHFLGAPGDELIMSNAASNAESPVNIAVTGKMITITIPATSAPADAGAWARLALVEEHLRAEGAQEMDALVNTFGATPYFMLNTARSNGRDGIRSVYQDMFTGFPDIQTEVKSRYVSDNAVILETVLSGTHNGTWNGIPPTGRKVSVPMCAIFPFDDAGKLAAEIVYFDSAILMQQLGLLPAAGTDVSRSGTSGSSSSGSKSPASSTPKSSS
jgi:steroid delta-isomerase-like uncharacterized protein